MALQNRVAPDGTIFADPARGLLMGNRGGVLHDGGKRLTARRWASKQWIACALAYKDRHETIMAPGRYTQLFFLDEATALAAGHRPCALCRRGDFLRFMEGWQRLHGLVRMPKVDEIDAVLHAERVGQGRSKVTFAARLGDLPAGVIVELGSDPILNPVAASVRMGSDPNSTLTGRTAHLFLDGALLPWFPAGYGVPAKAGAELAVRVLTPASIVAVIAGGYAPMLHPSARSMSAARST